jgi:putative ABC transport system substrate-binding protein
MTSVVDRRRFLVTSLAGAFAVPRELMAQPAGKVYRIGALSPGYSTEPPTLQREPLEQGLRDLGWIPGSNVVIEYRYAEGKLDRLQPLADELVRLKVDAIIARSDAAALAARKATTTIPIVVSSAANPIGSGLVDTLARPGKNVTGIANMSQDLEGKRLELLKEAVPRLARVALLRNPNMVRGPLDVAAARSLGLETQTFDVRSPQDIPEAFAAIDRARFGAILVFADIFILEPNRAHVVALALKYRLPAMYPWQMYVDAGGLMSYAVNIPTFHRRSATFVDKILRGANPAEIPVEVPTRLELVVNLKTAKALGLTIPPSVLARADQVIE